MRRGLAGIAIVVILLMSALQGALAHVACPNCAHNTDQNCGTCAPAPEPGSCCGSPGDEATGLTQDECVCADAETQPPADCPRASAPSPSDGLITTHAVVETSLEQTAVVGFATCPPPRAGNPVFHGGRSPPS